MYTLCNSKKYLSQLVSGRQCVYIVTKEKLANLNLPFLLHCHFPRFSSRCIPNTSPKWPNETELQIPLGWLEHYQQPLFLLPKGFYSCFWTNTFLTHFFILSFISQGFTESIMNQALARSSYTKMDKIK